MLSVVLSRSAVSLPRRCRRGWLSPVDAVTGTISSLPASAARMLAVEILLADPEALGDDVLESCLYLLRERLRAA